MATMFEQPQPTFDFPQPLTEAYKPQSISEFVGLAKHKAILSKLAANPHPVAILMTGEPGTGKTSLAFAFSRAVRAEVHHVPSQDCNLDNLQRIVDMCHRVPYDFSTGESCRFHCVIVDEADRMSAAAQTFLLSRLDGTKPCPSTIWIFTCNDDTKFQEPFLSRLNVKLPKFNTYGAGNDVRDLLSRVWKERANGAPEPDFSRIPSGNVREALQALEVELLAV